jgi:hypothetical protein
LTIQAERWYVRRVKRFTTGGSPLHIPQIEAQPLC